MSTPSDEPPLEMVIADGAEHSVHNCFLPAADVCVVLPPLPSQIVLKDTAYKIAATPQPDPTVLALCRSCWASCATAS